MKQLVDKELEFAANVFIDDKDWDDWIEWFIGSLSLEQQQQIHNLLHREDV